MSSLHNTSGPGFDQWRSPPPQHTPLMESSTLPQSSPHQSHLGLQPNSPAPTQAALVGKNDLLHPSFLAPCEHSNGDMHAHAFDLLSFSSDVKQTQARPSLPHASTTSSVVPSSVPAHPTSYLSASRPPAAPSIPNGHVNGNGQANGTTPAAGVSSGPVPKARRMSSSTTGALGRGKLGLTGETNGAKEVRPPIPTHPSYNSTNPIPNRRPTLGSSPIPQLYDFAKTDRRPSATKPADHRGRSASTSVVPGSLPNRSILHAHARAPPTPASADDMELDMEFGDDDEEGEGSGSAEAEDGEEGDWKKLALGSGSGGVKGRRKGMVFKCEHCSKEYRHPSCLVKHRWEHSPHWKEPTQLSMSKHQQVQMLEAAAILAHLHPTGGKALPTDKSLWPAILGSPGDQPAPIRRASQSHSAIRSPPSTIAPLTPSSLREPSSFGGAMSERSKDRKSSPGSDSTTSSMGAGEPVIPQAPQSALSPSTSYKPLGPGSVGRAGSFSSSLPRQLAEMRFGYGGTPNGGGQSFLSNGASPKGGFSPDPRMPLGVRTGMIGGGMFGNGSLNTARPSSSIRSGVEDVLEDEDEEEDMGYSRLANGLGRGRAHGKRAGDSKSGKSSSEEVEERRKDDDYGMAMEMEL